MLSTNHQGYDYKEYIDYLASCVDRMNLANRTLQLTKRQKVSLYVTYLLALGMLALVGAEVILRIKGIKPWRTYNTSVKVDPGGRFYQKYPTLGYSHVPGRYTVTLNSGYSFKVTHLPNTLRITHPIGDMLDQEPKEEIWIFGCSCTYGWCLNDEETYPWLLQARFPEYEVVNFGVNGYGTIHSLLQFRGELKRKPPRIAILAYGDFHDERNTFSRTQRKKVHSWNELGPLVQPYARLDREDRLEIFFADPEYDEFPLMRYLSLSHFIEMQYDRFEYKMHRSHAVSEALVAEMARLAREYEVKFIVANISVDRAILSFADKNRILNTDISVDPNLPENTNLPHDGHPSAKANMKYADKLEGFVRATLLE